MLSKRFHENLLPSPHYPSPDGFVPAQLLSTASRKACEGRVQYGPALGIPKALHRYAHRC